MLLAVAVNKNSPLWFVESRVERSELFGFEYTCDISFGTLVVLLAVANPSDQCINYRQCRLHSSRCLMIPASENFGLTALCYR